VTKGCATIAPSLSLNDNAMPTRLALLNAWLRPCLDNLFPKAAPLGELSAIGSDASFRRYFRWSDGTRRFIVMDAPPPKENCRPFVRMAKVLANAGLHVPQVLAADLEQGFLLLTDLGEQTYLDVLNENNADSLFEDALQSLLLIQKAQVPNELAVYDQGLLQRELQLFPDWYLAKHLGVTFTGAQQSAWQRICDKLIENALAQPKVLVHRDYMPRNLMLSTPNPGILDFQDAVLGPLSYDVTCLFKDAFISWPKAQVENWLKRYWTLAQQAGIKVPSSFADFQRDSDFIAVQRHLKVIGIFSRICYRDGKRRYLTDLPRFFRYLQEVLARRKELSELASLLADLPTDKSV